MKARDVLLGMAFAIAVVLAVACGGGGDSTSELAEGTVVPETLFPTSPLSEDDYDLAVAKVQRAVGRAGFGVAEALVEFDLCVTDQECGDTMLLLAEEYVPYVTLLDEQIEALNEIDPPPAFQSLHDNLTKQFSLRKEAGELWIKGITDTTLDEATAVELLALSQEKLRESQALYLDILDDLQELLGEDVP